MSAARTLLPKALLALALLAGAGCGIGDYEARMQDEQDRLKRIDDENAALSAPAKLKDPWLFFRPPKGFNSVPKDKLEENLFQVLPPIPNSDTPFHEIDVAATSKDKEDLPGLVWNALKVGKQPTTSVKVGEKAGHKPKIFDKASFRSGDMIYYVYFYREEVYQVVIVYRVTAPDEKDTARLQKVRGLVDTGMEYSLGSLAVGAAAKQRERSFRAPPKKDK